MKTKRRKGLDATWYATRRIADGKWGTRYDHRGTTFSKATLRQTRHEAGEAVGWSEEWEIVPCRVVPLSARSARSKKRTR